MPLTVEGHPRILSGPSSDPGLTLVPATVTARIDAEKPPGQPAPKAIFDLRTYASWDGAGAPGGPPKAEPGAGSAGPGAAQRRRLMEIGTNLGAA